MAGWAIDTRAPEGRQAVLDSMARLAAPRNACEAFMRSRAEARGAEVRATTTSHERAAVLARHKAEDQAIASRIIGDHAVEAIERIAG